MIAFDVQLQQGRFLLDVQWQSQARCLGICGPSGSGKSSLLEALAGWRTPRRLNLRLDAFSVPSAQIPPERRELGYVPQDGLLWPHLCVRENLALGCANPQLAQRTVAVLGIKALLERLPADLSGGERQRVALARAIARQPRALLLDEPLGALDAGLRRRILPYLARVGEEFRIPTLFVSHDPAEVLALCDEMVLLEAGRIVRGGPPAVLLREQDSVLGAFENIFHGEVVQADDGTALLQLAEGGQVSVAARGIQVGERVLFSIRSDEILVALERPTRISARNVLPAVVIAVVEEGNAGVRVDARLDEGRGALLSAVLSAAAVRELGLSAGAELYLIFKANSCRLFTSQP